MATTNIQPTQSWGTTTIGVAPSIIWKQRSMIKAIGESAPGVCANIALAWAFRESKKARRRQVDPRLAMPREQIKTWFRLYRKASGSQRADIHEVWHKATKVLKHKSTRWCHVRGPMKAAIATLLDMGWVPVHPTKWKSDSGQIFDFYAVPGVSHHRVLHQVEVSLERRLWASAAEARNNSGYQYGVPDFSSASRAYNEFKKNEKETEARALKCTITNKSWTKMRLMDEDIINEENDESLECERCGASNEDERHRY